MSTMPAPTARPHLHVSLPALREWGFGALALAWYALSALVLGLPGFLSVFVLGSSSCSRWRPIHAHRVAGRFTALMLPLVVVLTATYDWGYPQYREDGLSRPETGNVLISVTTFATANPVGSVVAHVSQHVAAVSHAYESRIFNPPETKS